jgi:hypothetical protein
LYQKIWQPWFPDIKTSTTNAPKFFSPQTKIPAKQWQTHESIMPTVNIYLRQMYCQIGCIRISHFLIFYQGIPNA